MKNIETRQLAGMFLRGMRMATEGAALQNEAVRGISSLINEQIQEKCKKVDWYVFGGEKFELLSVSCRADSSSYMGNNDVVQIRIAFILSDLDTHEFKGATAKEKDLIGQMRETIKKYKDAHYSNIDRDYYLGKAHDIQSGWTRLGWLKHKYVLLKELDWEISVEKIIKNGFEISLGTGETTGTTSI